MNAREAHAVATHKALQQGRHRGTKVGMWRGGRKG